jgi:syntaxin 8
MSSPALLTLSQKLTTTSSLLLERSRVLSLNLPPSASSQNQIVRNLTVIKNELDKLEGASVLAGQAASKGKDGQKTNQQQQQPHQQQQIDELAQQYDRLLDMFAEDEVGREKGKALRREKKWVLRAFLLLACLNIRVIALLGMTTLIKL